MANHFSVLERFKKLCPPHVQPIFTDPEGWQKFSQEVGEKESLRIIGENRSARLHRIIGRSGIQPLHQGCTLDNYLVENADQRLALTMTRRYIDRFDGGFGGFIFSGLPGTGKNHMAAAIGNELMQQGKTVLVVTVIDLMTKLHETYGKDAQITEAKLLNDLCEVDLLILDDVGVQRGTTNEKVILFQIIDRRTANRKPVGILTNLNEVDLKVYLDDRIMDRMLMDGGLWVNFNWKSYRSRVNTKTNQTKD